jgi:polysaccharide export outer membrane protein
VNTGLFFLLLSLSQAPAENPQPEQSHPQPTADYLVGPEDLLEVRVFQLEELSQIVRVSQAGTVQYPLLGNIQVSGKTRSQLAAHLSALFEKKFIRDPQVTVFIQEYRSRRVSVMGAVFRPDTYELIGDKRLLDVLGNAGGVTQEAGKALFVIRENADPFEADLTELLQKGRPELNIRILPGDVINVPKAEVLTIFVYGEVQAPGSFTVERDRALTALQAVAMAGGQTRRASMSKTTVHRRVKESGSTRLYRVNLKKVIKGQTPDMVLEDGDTVVIPRSFF